MKPLLRLAVWGLAAAASVTTVVYVGRTDLGAKRLADAIAAIGAPPADPQQTATTQLTGRIAGTEREARRALETVQAISADRERLQSRIIAVENELAEVTATVRRSPSATTEPKSAPEAKPVAPEARSTSQSSNPPPPSANQSTSVLPSSPVASSVALMQSRNPVPGWTAMSIQPSGPAQQSAAAASEAVPALIPAVIPVQKPAAPPVAERPAEPAAAPSPGPVSIPLPRAAPAAAAPSSDTAATAKANKADEKETTASVPAQETALKVEYGVDLGPGLTVARLRARWSKLAAERPDLVRGLHPLLSVRDTANGKPVEVRLLVGPVANVDSANAFCQALVSTQYLCRPSVFDGQRLAVQ